MTSLALDPLLVHFLPPKIKFLEVFFFLIMWKISLYFACFLAFFQTSLHFPIITSFIPADTISSWNLIYSVWWIALLPHPFLSFSSAVLNLHFLVFKDSSSCLTTIIPSLYSSFTLPLSIPCSVFTKNNLTDLIIYVRFIHLTLSSRFFIFFSSPHCIMMNYSLSPFSLLISIFKLLCIFHFPPLTYRPIFKKNDGFLIEFYFLSIHHPSIHQSALSPT